MACFMPISVPQTGGYCYPAVATENGLFRAYFGTPQEGREKATYYVREEKVLWSHFSPPHIVSKIAARETRKPVIMDRISMTLPYPPSVNHYWSYRDAC